MTLFKRKKPLGKKKMDAIAKASENMLACRLCAIDLRKEGKDKEAIMYDDIADSISGLLRIVAEDHQGMFGVDVRVEEGSTEDGK